MLIFPYKYTQKVTLHLAVCNFATSQVLDSYVVTLLSKFQLQKSERFVRFVGK